MTAETPIEANNKEVLFASCKEGEGRIMNKVNRKLEKEKEKRRKRKREMEKRDLLSSLRTIHISNGSVSTGNVGGRHGSHHHPSQQYYRIVEKEEEK